MVPQSEGEQKDNIIKDIEYQDIIKTKPTTEANLPTKPKVGPETMLMLRHKIYSEIMFRCEECNEKFKNKIALATNSYSQNRKYLENTEYFL